MEILINYNGNMIRAIVIDDYKVSVSSKDVGLTDRIHEIAIELDQCKECGQWKSEDEELYGDGYCTRCATMCETCQRYFNSQDILFKDRWYICEECNEKEISQK
jgi:hypothetical protein